MKKIAVFMLTSFLLTSCSYSNLSEIRVLYENRKYDEALESIKENLDKKRVEKYYELEGMINIKNKNWEDALRDFNNVIAIDDSVPEYYLNRATVYMNMGKYDKAKTDLEMCIENKSLFIDKDSEVLAYSNYANVLVLLEDYENALKNIDITIALEDSEPYFYDMKASILMKLGRNKAAMETVDNGISVNSDYNNFYYLKGKINLKNEKYKEALELFKKVANLGEVEGYYYATLCLRKLEKQHEALAYIDLYLEEQPEDAQGYLQKGVILTDIGKNNDAIDILKKAVKLDGSMTDANYYIGINYSRMKKYDDAINYLNLVSEDSEMYEFAVDEVKFIEKNRE